MKAITFPNLRDYERFLVITKYRLVICRVAKVASQSLLKTVRDSRIDHYELKNAKLPTEYRIINFVRDPIDRFKSMYRNKIIEKANPIGMKALGFTFDTTVSEAVDIICKTPDDKADLHFMSQSAYLGNLQEHAELYRFEDINKVWQKLQQHCDYKLAPLGHVNQTKNHNVELTVEDKYRLHHRYANDFSLCDSLRIST